MATPVELTLFDPLYPSRLRTLRRPPPSVTVRGGPLEAARTVAIVGSRNASPDARRFSRKLAAALVETGAVVVSGGAVGIDAAAHWGAMKAGGRTWVVAATGCHHCYPSDHGPLFEAVGRGPGAMVWPFAPATPVRHGAFLGRNRVLVALSDAVVVGQAGFPSGALCAAACARAMRRPLWVVPSAPWAKNSEGTMRLLGEGVRPLTSIASFLLTLELPPPDVEVDGSTTEPPRTSKDPIEAAVLGVLSAAPIHIDEIATRAHVAVQAAAAALLTLALEAVVVEGPPSYFRQR